MEEGRREEGQCYMNEMGSHSDLEDVERSVEFQKTLVTVDVAPICTVAGWEMAYVKGYPAQSATPLEFRWTSACLPRLLSIPYRGYHEQQICSVESP